VPLDIDIDALLAEVAECAAPHAADGEPGTFIPALADLPTDSFGLAVVDMDGNEHVTGETDVAFPIQSISKVFALVNAMRKADAADGVSKELWRRIGREPSGTRFNSLVQLEYEQGIPRNPMINAGALVVDDLLISHCADPKAENLGLLEGLAGEPLSVDDAVLEDEGNRSDRNLAMAYLMSSFGNLRHDPHDVLDVYVHQCAIQMTARQLARSIRFLANGGVDPASGERILRAELARRVNAVMLTSGTYDNAGEFAFSVGIPSKSGVAGAIVATVVGELGVCVWSPPLDGSGNSLAGRVALHELSERLELSLFSAERTRDRSAPGS
jgi:glutaminase